MLMIMFYTLLAVYAAGVCLLGYWAKRLLNTPDAAIVKKFAWFVPVWPLALLLLIYIGIKANYTGNYEQGLLDWSKRR